MVAAMIVDGEEQEEEMEVETAASEAEECDVSSESIPCTLNY